MDDRRQRAEDSLNHHQQRPVSQTIDIERLKRVLTAVVRRGQHALTSSFEKKKPLIQFDLNDHCLMKAFYDFATEK